MISQSLKEKVYSTILSSVISGKYLAGSFINEKTLCDELQASRAPVREALIELCAQDILKSYPRKGYLVVKYTERELHELVDFRILIECDSLRRNFDKITSTQIAQLDAIVQNEFLLLFKQDVRDYWNSSINFHMTLAANLENTYTYKQLYAALNASMRGYLQLYWHEWTHNGFPPPSELHAKVVACIREGDRDRAIEYLREDIDTFGSLSKHREVE
ncbi:MAG: GntR family transcriptional regulator [Clostridia bacterium]|nr:GntR family transcriptional regulator [Clostridia bacterium]